MAHKRKDTLVKAGEWWDHLRPFNKRKVSKAERRAARVEINSEIDISDEMVGGLALHKNSNEMRRFVSENGLGVVPYGIYCYDQNGMCPYLDRAENKDKQNNGFCWLMGKGDWDENMGELWDSCKCCGVHDKEIPDGTLGVEFEQDALRDFEHRMEMERKQENEPPEDI